MNDKPYYELELVAFFFDENWAAESDDRRWVHRYNRNLAAAAHPAAAVLAEGRIVLIPVADLDPNSVAVGCVRDNLFAEAFIPHHDADGIAYGFICHVFNRLNHEPAILEALTLQRVAPDILARFRERCVLVEAADA